MSKEYLYPARPGMLRRGTPMATSSGAVGTVERCDDRGWIITEHSALSDLIREDCGERPEWAGSCGLGDYYACSSRWWLDLRDSTSRAHAAMVYTELCNQFGSLMFSGLIPASAYLGGAWWMLPKARAVLNMLARMRSLDESVTVVEACAVLDWAHAASGGEG